MGGLTDAIIIVCSSNEQAGLYVEEIEKIYQELYGIEGIKSIDYEKDQTLYGSKIEVYRGDSFVSYVSIPILESLFRMEKVHHLFYELFKAICNKLEPIYAQFGGYDGQLPVHASLVEYYKDPYYFCVEPVKSEDRFFHLQSNQARFDIKKAQEIMDKKELIVFIKKYTFKSFETPSGGVGCWKIENEARQGINSFFVYPRYFIREELRKRGMHVPFGLSEFCYFSIHKNSKQKEFFEACKQALESENPTLIEVALHELRYTSDCEKESHLKFLLGIAPEFEENKDLAKKIQDAIDQLQQSLTKKK